MKRRSSFIFVFFLLVFSFNGYCQGVNNIWITGYYSGATPPFGTSVIDFSNGSPSIVNQPMSLSFKRTNASIADASGNLLFYTNGFTVCNNLTDTMPSGSGLDSSSEYSGWYLDGMPSPQAVIILSYPNHPDSFFLFHQTIYFIQWPNVATVAPLELYYSIVDMTLDSGKGDLVDRQVTFLQDTIQNGRLTACKHANGRDWWLVTREAYSDMFYVFLITPSGISPPITQHIGSVLFPPDIGQVCFSPQGNKYALVDHFNHLRLYDFDRCTGVFNNPVYVPILDSMIARGAAFSPSGRYLYITSDVYIYQYDMLASNIDSSRQTVAVWDSFYSPSPPFATTFYTEQLAPDGKIYITTGNGTDRMHVINYPDSAGLACDVCQHCVVLPTYNSFGCIPNHPNYFLGAEIGSICDTITVVTENDHPPRNIPLKLYPNPANDFFWLDYDLTNFTGNGELVVYNTLGEVVLRKTLYNYFKTAKVECGKLAKGIYYLSIASSGKNVSSSKFIKQ